MANVLITSSCPRKCSFCFAKTRLGRSRQQPSRPYMALDDVRKVMNFLDRTGERDLRLLGGEPTLHPDFIEIVKEAIDRGFHVHVFTNGMMRKATADFLAGLSADRLSLLCNVSPQANDTEKQKERVYYALERLGPRAQVGITLTSPQFEYDFILECIKRFKLRKRIRIGIAQPIVGEHNSFLKPSEYREAGSALVRMAKECVKHDILIGFDCGLTMCMFSEEEIGTIAKCTEGFRILCNAIIDIGTDLDVWHCFPLSEVLNTHLDKHRTRNDIAHAYRKATMPYRTLGCMPECVGCKYLLRGQCTGGCLAHAMNSLHRMPPRYLEDMPSHSFKREVC